MTDKFTIGSQWKTRGGWRAVVVEVETFVDAGIAYHANQVANVQKYNCDGHAFIANDLYDLIEPWKEPVVHKGWLHIIADKDTKDDWNISFSTDELDCYPDDKSIKLACIPIKFTEGEGLQHEGH